MVKWLRACLTALGIGGQEAVGPPVRKFIRHMHDVAGPFTRARTVVLYTADEHSEPALVGTGIAAAIAGRRFIVTAAHVLDEPLASKGGIYVSPGTPGGKLVALDGCRVNKSQMPPTGDRRDDPFDVAVITLDEGIVAQLGAGITFTSIDEMDLSEDVDDKGYFFLHGFPLDQFHVNRDQQSVHATSRPYGTILYEGKRGTWLSARGPIHVDLDYPSRLRKNIDDFGRRTALGAPVGISGCGIWRLVRPGVSQLEWNEREVRLIAIEHRWRDDIQAVRGTKVIYAMQIIANNFPDCDQEIRRRLARVFKFVSFKALERGLEKNMGILNWTAVAADHLSSAPSRTKSNP